MPRPVLVFGGTMAIAGMVYWQIGFLVPWLLYWLAAFSLALVLGALARPGASPFGPPGGRFLCDSCRYNYGDVCRRSERPNAIRCPDYRSTEG